MGFVVGIAERCGAAKLEGYVIPKTFDDSMIEGGRAYVDFRNGYDEAMKSERPCFGDVEGRRDTR